MMEKRNPAFPCHMGRWGFDFSLHKETGMDFSSDEFRLRDSFSVL
jgi:hypothetical protein